MKIYRGPYSTGELILTDSKNPSDYLEQWKINRRIFLDATKDKTGDKHTQIGIELNNHDVISMFEVVMSEYVERNEIMANKLNNIGELVYGKPMRLGNKGLSKEQLLDIVENIKDILRS